MDEDRRRYRFRVWDEATGKIYPVISITRGGLVMQDDEMTITSPREGLVIMQYSGLKDIAGIEIYEGDIVTYNTGPEAGQTGRVGFDEGAFRLVIDSQEVNPVLNHQLINENSVSVSGNIYQDL